MKKPQEHGNCAEGWTAIRRGEVLDVELWYPKRDGEERPDKANCVEIGLIDVRAADSIRVSYDFTRDGWVISQATNWDEDQSEKPLAWREVHFVRAWALEPA